MKLNKNTIQQFIDDINNALSIVAQKYGADFTVLEPKYSEAYLEAKITFSMTGAEEAQREERMQFFYENCESVGLDKSYWGKSFRYKPLDNHLCSVYGLDFHDRDNPLLLLDEETKKLYRISVMFFLRIVDLK